MQVLLMAWRKTPQGHLTSSVPVSLFDDTGFSAFGVMAFGVRSSIEAYNAWRMAMACYKARPDPMSL